jgi:branched-chain amino acid transport system permease protein
MTTVAGFASFLAMDTAPMRAFGFQASVGVFLCGFLAMVVVGGLGSIMGAIAGAILLSWLDLQLRNILDIPYLGEWLTALSQSYFSITGVSNIQFIVFGLIMIAIMLFEPLGIYGIWLRTKIYWRTWPF